jgi:hypothetical protein
VGEKWLHDVEEQTRSVGTSGYEEGWSAPDWVEALIPGRVRGYGTPEEVLC